MKRLALTFAFAVSLYVAAPVAQAFATYHVRPPSAELQHQVPSNTEWDWGNVPAWVQAIGSIFAILTAVYIGHRNHMHSERVFEETRYHDEADRRLKARSLALALYPELLEMKAKVAGLRTSDRTMFTPLKIPPVLLESINRLYLLEEAGASIQQLVAISRQFNRMQQDILDMPSTGPEKIKLAKETLAVHLKVIGTTLDEAIELLGPVYDLSD